MDKYGLGYLEDTFKKHSEQAEKSRQEMLDHFKTMNPEEALPDHLKDAFNLPWALHAMVEEIIQLREEIARLKGKE